MKLSVIVPCYNEQGTIKQIINKVQNVSLQFEKEIIIVDDSSEDNTRKILENNFSNTRNIKIFYHNKNLGKGSAIKTAKKYISGDIIIFKMQI